MISFKLALVQIWSRCADSPFLWPWPISYTCFSKEKQSRSMGSEAPLFYQCFHLVFTLVIYCNISLDKSYTI